MPSAFNCFIRGAGMAQWREHSPLTKVARLDSISGLGVICGLSLSLVLILAQRGFTAGSPVFPSLQKLQFHLERRHTVKCI